MLNKVLFRIRSAILDIGPLLGSWKLSIVLMIASAVFYFILTIYAATTPSHVVGNIASLLVFQATYLLLLVNTGVCLWNRLTRLKHETSNRPIFSSATPRLETRQDNQHDAERRLRRHRFRVISRDDDSFFAIRNRWTAIGTYLFHGAFFFIALGFLISTASRVEEKVRVAIGEEFTADSTQYFSRTAPRPLTLTPPLYKFTVEDIRPSLWRDQLLFTSLEADITPADGGRRSTTKINRPLIVHPVSFLRLSGFGYAPRYELVDASGQIVETAFVKMDIFPPGQRDFFLPESVPFRVYVEIFPDAEIENDAAVNKSMNLVEPIIFVSVYRGRFEVTSGALRPGEVLPVEGIGLRFPEIRYWGEFSFVHDRGIVWIFFGFLVGLVGLAMKLPGSRSEARWMKHPDGSGTITIWTSKHDDSILFEGERA